ncbi:gas vesicle protein K [Microbispora hainanensis]|uniref:Gas vesicle protein K n=1 Tax=Microbispora hainanensis TaxID=568844 RepID=A0A544YAY0_9ACTN|nr:gas vesicle protein K [Microbispora hainanensis]
METGAHQWKPDQREPTRWERDQAEPDQPGTARSQPDQREPDQPAPGPEPGRGGPWRLNTDPDAVRRDLSRLVLTLVELVRQLVERQAIRRMDQGDLSDEQVETLGLTLMRLEEAMNELCERFDISPSDLNLDLGPLGTLLPTDP